MCVQYLFIYMLWAPGKKEGELVILVLQGDVLSHYCCWRVGVIWVIIVACYSFLPLT